MSHTRFLPILLTAVMIAQSVIVEWGHSHVHVADALHSDLSVAVHAHHHHLASDRYHVHLHHSHEHPPLPNQPTDKEDCSICRHLALAAIVTLDLEAVAIGDAAEAVQEHKSSFVSTIAVGLRRPRSPPELS